LTLINTYQSLVTLKVNEQETQGLQTTRRSGVADLETCPYSYVLPHLIWSYCIGCCHIYRRTTKIGER